MEEQFDRTRILLGDTAMDRLRDARVAVFGIGGVGGYVCEALARSGVGKLELIDSDRVSLTNLNRQIIATHETLGRYKTEVMRERILSINPAAEVRIHSCFFLPENADRFPFAEYDYVVDAVDTVAAKIELVCRAKACHIPVISCMGAGNKLDASRFRVADLYETKVCPLARVMRRELRRRQVEHLKVVYSEEEPVRVFAGQGGQRESGTEAKESLEAEYHVASAAEPEAAPENGSQMPALTGWKPVPGSVAFVPSVAGLIAAGEVVKDLTTNWHC